MTRQHHLLFLPWMFSLSNPRPGLMPFLIHACHHQNGYSLARRRFINFLFTSAVAQSARLRADSVSAIFLSRASKPACGAEASVSSGSTRSARACRGHLLSRKFSSAPRSRLILCSVFSCPLSSQRSREDVYNF